MFNEEQAREILEKMTNMVKDLPYAAVIMIGSDLGCLASTNDRITEENRHKIFSGSTLCLANTLIVDYEEEEEDEETKYYRNL